MDGLLERYVLLETEGARYIFEVKKSTGHKEKNLFFKSQQPSHIKHRQHFKAFNDAYGFYAGDQMIKRVGFLLDSLRRTYPDKVFVGHAGGDDFVVLLWGISLE